VILSIPHRKSFHWSLLLEVFYCALLAGMAYHLVAERIDHKTLPHGDEGSWMAAATELSYGNGFSTRWLEHGFLKPYALPRPDDYRYPGLVCLLAVAFLIFGCSYTTALTVVGCTFLLFGLAVYFVVRKAYGRKCAAAVLPLVYFSLLQLMYSTEVYTEALFGVVLALILFVSLRFRPTDLAWWLLSGAGIGLLYLVRPNAVLFAVALFFYSLYALFRPELKKEHIISGLAVMVAVMLPWLIRSWVLFGNPFHLAGSAGLLRAAASDPCTYSIRDFTGIHGRFYFVKTVFANITTFFSILHEQEHGLELIPLAFCLVGIVAKKTFFNGVIATGFLLTLLACAYTSAGGNWAGARYFSPFLPFVYAYGVDRIFRLADLLTGRFKRFPGILFPTSTTVVVTGLLLLPVLYPHRYYERFYAKTPSCPKDYSSYYAVLKSKLSGHPFYYAGSLAQINFATGLNCIGMQHLFDETEIRRAQKTFHPRLMALRPGEFTHPYFQRLMDALKNDGCVLTESSADSFAVIVDIKEPEGRHGSSPLLQSTGHSSLSPISPGPHTRPF
jgi:hypothetical protein